MKLIILGEEYDFAGTTEKEDSHLCGNDGYHDGYAKIIRFEEDYNENHPSSIQNWDEFKARVKRHEIIHAFFFVSGLTEYSHDEQLVEWIAAQFPKMLRVFNEVGAIQAVNDAIQTYV